ncbi:MAG: MerR family transcriptional regulator [Syntrophomonas sp.]
MEQRTYSTKKIAELSGVHPNTVRLYESWGYISSPRRLANNYRVFTDLHLLQMRLARVALPGPYPINGRLVQQMVREFAAGNLEESLALAQDYLAGVRLEQKRAVRALAILDDWMACRVRQKPHVIIKGRIKAAQALDITIDALRTWERNGLFTIQRNERGILNFTGLDLEKIEVIRLLRNCGYTISSLLRVFNRDETVLGKPSLLLSLPDDDADFFYVTDRFLQYLKDHEQRAQKILAMIEDYKKKSS